MLTWAMVSSCVDRRGTRAHLPGSETVEIQERRVSDAYRYENVVRVDFFEWRIKGHVMALMQLQSGDIFPMLCRVSGKSVYPIPQSVVALPKGEGFRIVGEVYMRHVDGSAGFHSQEIKLHIEENGPREVGENVGTVPKYVDPRPTLVKSPLI